MWWKQLPCNAQLRQTTSIIINNNRIECLHLRRDGYEDGRSIILVRTGTYRYVFVHVQAHTGTACRSVFIISASLLDYWQWMVISPLEIFVHWYFFYSYLFWYFLFRPMYFCLCRKCLHEFIRQSIELLWLIRHQIVSPFLVLRATPYSGCDHTSPIDRSPCEWREEQHLQQLSVNRE